MTTEKELADQLFEAHGGPVLSDDEWRKLARTAAEALGSTLDPEGPKPGTLHLSPNGRAYLAVKQESPEGRDAVLISGGETVPINSYLTPWTKTVPARVISEEEYTNLLAEVASLQESLDEARDLQRTFQREKDEWEANYQRLVSIRADEESNPADDQYVSAKPPVLTEDEVGELWDALASSRAEWEAYTGPFHEHVTAVINAARAKHGGARELPGRDELWEALNDRMTWLGSQAARDVADIVMDLLRGGSDE